MLYIPQVDRTVRISCDIMEYPAVRANKQFMFPLMRKSIYKPPRSVVQDAQRMAVHRRLAETSTLAAVRKLRSELADRYGRLPRPAQRLVKLAEFRVLCAQAHISRLDVVGGKAVFYRDDASGVAFVGRVSGTTAERKIASLFRLLEKGG